MASAWICGMYAEASWGLGLTRDGNLRRPQTQSSFSLFLQDEEAGASSLSTTSGSSSNPNFCLFFYHPLWHVHSEFVEMMSFLGEWSFTITCTALYYTILLYYYILLYFTYIYIYITFVLRNEKFYFSARKITDKGCWSSGYWSSPELWHSSSCSVFMTEEIFISSHCFFCTVLPVTALWPWSLCFLHSESGGGTCTLVFA